MDTTKLFVTCPTCAGLGQRQILGELKDGFLMVKRFGQGFTLIRGEFEVLCDKCKELVFFKTLQEGGAIHAGTVLSDHRLERLSRLGTIAGTN